MQHLVVMLPVLNEALGLAWVLERIPYLRLESMGYRTTVLVMDGHSTDGTSEVAKEYGVLFVGQDEHGEGQCHSPRFSRGAASRCRCGGHVGRRRNVFTR